MAVTSATSAASRISTIQASVAALRRNQPAGQTSFSNVLDRASAAAPAITRGAAADRTTGTTWTGGRSVGERVATTASGLVRSGTSLDGPTATTATSLIKSAFGAVGVEMPASLDEQSRMGRTVGSLDQAQVGDLLTFGNPATDLAIFVGAGKMIHASPSGEATITSIDRPVTAVRRVVTDDLAGPRGSDPATAGPATESNDPEEWGPLFVQAGERHGVDPALLMAVAEIESGFVANAVSPVGAQGLMQFMPATAAEMGVDPFDPASAIDGAARYLAREIDRFGSVDLALAAYNAGPGAVQRFGGIPPYPETQNYVTKVTTAWEERS